MTSEPLGPYSRWLAMVATAAKRRPWWHRNVDDDGEDVEECEGCDAHRDDDADSAHEHDDMLGPCPFAALDAALDKEPT